MNQKNIAKPTKNAPSPSPSPVQSPPRNSSLHTRLYKGSIDCGIQVNRKLQCDIAVQTHNFGTHFFSDCSKWRIFCIVQRFHTDMVPNGAVEYNLFHHIWTIETILLADKFRDCEQSRKAFDAIWELHYNVYICVTLYLYSDSTHACQFRCVILLKCKSLNHHLFIYIRNLIQGEIVIQELTKTVQNKYLNI